MRGRHRRGWSREFEGGEYSVLRDRERVGSLVNSSWLHFVRFGFTWRVGDSLGGRRGRSWLGSSRVREIQDSLSPRPRWYFHLAPTRLKAYDTQNSSLRKSNQRVLNGSRPSVILTPLARTLYSPATPDYKLLKTRPAVHRTGDPTYRSSGGEPCFPLALIATQEAVHARRGRTRGWDSRVRGAG